MRQHGRGCFNMQEATPKQQAQGYIMQALAQLASMPFSSATGRRPAASASPVLVHLLVEMVGSGNPCI